MSDKVMGIVRTILAALGGVLVAIGVMDAESWGAVVQSIETIVGAIGVIAVGVASVFAKIKGKDAA